MPASSPEIPFEAPRPRGEDGRLGGSTTWIAVLDESDDGARLHLVTEPGPTAALIVEASGCELLFSGTLAPDVRPTDGKSDADTVLSAYLRDGPSLFKRLRGRFALVLLDRRTSVSYALRDPLGAHPLFYAGDARTLYLSPSAEAVARREGRVPELNRLEAAAFILRTSLDPEETLFDGVRRLLQCHLLERRDTELQIKRYWEPEAEREAVDVVEELHRRLVQAIERSVDGRAGVFLSGGLDSALVAAVLTHVARFRGLPPPVALSIAFDGPDGDEEAMQRIVASRLGLEHVVHAPSELVGPGRVLESALALGLGATPEPPELPTALYDVLATVGASRGCTAILGGSGGDEWLNPQPVYAADCVRSFDVPALIELVRAWHGYWPGLSRVDALRRVVWRSGARSLGRRLALSTPDRFTQALIAGVRSSRAKSRIPDWLVPDETLRRHLVAAVVARTAPGWRDLETEKQASLEGANLSMAQEITFAAERRTGVGFGSPLLDPDVVTFLYCLSPRRLTEGGRAKALARDILSRYLGDLADAWPRTVYGNSLWAEAIRAEGARAWSLAGGAPLLAALGVIEPRQLEAILRHPAAQASAFELAPPWRALSLDSWFRNLRGRVHPL